ncbi:PBSX family phage terminase large subunit [uncultured Flavonifractor sp.]|uniref:PBSX family phage terminase large subunit n=1 Tax=uncultured Flavonifractor sp. TaxID=1193534 RepID=UPI002633D9C3|nr:PBSX family phage terminase large subunit [uncultured Flavonifractor sp.]
MRFRAFSPKQRQVLTWWCAPGTRQREAIICDGAVRSGKTLCMGLSFFCWAMRCYRGQTFGLCGKTVTALRRNLLGTLLPVLRELGFQWEEKVSQNRLTVRFGGGENTFYLFGGKDEGSAALIQGITLAGVLLDEVALMPRSFVEQACARCSVEGSRLWFSCNPEGPEHWFYKQWIQKLEERNALYLHFTMEDNPALSPRVIRRYARSFSGTFYRRFVLGEWVAAEGRVYDFFDESWVRPVPEGEMERWRISCDYGTVNPASFGLWGRREGVWYRVREFYYDSRAQRRQKTDGEYADDLEKLAGGRNIETVVVDPSAASFIELLRRRGWRVEKAENDVLAGIRITAELLRKGELVICSSCADAIREFSLYCWDEKAVGDRVKKLHDHAMDDIRYFAVSVSEEKDGPWMGLCVERSRF